jgi:farnesyl diphosphate synthase
VINFQESLQEISLLLKEKMDALLPEPEIGKDGQLLEAMRYSSLSGGKRLRPFLTIISASLFGVSESCALQTAAAIEFVHSYSLIHDDLPSMDNDIERRGQPSCHIKYDEATAILAGDALLTLAFEIIADKTTHPDSNVRCELISSLAKAIGHGGMAGGQMLDMLFDNADLTINEIIRMQRMKTGELFAVACEAGAILGRASRNLRIALRGYAHAIGLAFQIIDDLLDTDCNKSDKSNESQKNKVSSIPSKPNYITTMGIDKSREQAKMLVNQAIAHLHVFDHKADLLRQLANYVIEREH